MGNQFRVEVWESSEQLQHRLRHAVTAATKERIQMLYRIKTGAITTRQELSQRLGRNESTVYRWLKRYKDRLNLWMGLHHFRFIKCNFIENWY
ncbi:MAG: helix-turn-helix domain-containing protein [Calothrix sp. MO_167.B42]|nr:helix-turn-helix domain-containing protein [Calothrix sp. MO_167.B42]